MGTISGIAGLLFVLKIILHLYLLSKINDDFSLLDYSSPVSSKRAMMLLPFMDDVLKNYSTLKTIINILYAFAVTGIIFFLIWITAFKNSS